MSTLNLSFSLPDERTEATHATRGDEYFSVLYDIVAEARRRIKYENAGDELDAFYAWMWRELKDRGIDPFEE